MANFLFVDTSLIWTPHFYGAAATLLIKSKLPPSCKKKRLYRLQQDYVPQKVILLVQPPVSTVTKILAWF